MIYSTQNRMTEFPLTSTLVYKEPFHEVELDAVFTAPDGSERRVPGFWAGDDDWKVRYASPIVGRHRYRTFCSDLDNTGLHGLEGQVDVRPYEGDNPLFKHGPITTSGNNRYLEHRDGTPFFWLGDTWWHGLTKRFRWPEDFHYLAADRASKGLSVIHIVAGLLPEVVHDDFWSKWTANEAGWAWDRDFARINPAFFDEADLRIAHLVRSGLVPCIFSAWGYYLKYAGTENMKKHWRYLVARWGAYPVIWTLAGEMTMPPYDDRKEEYRKELHDSWAEVDDYLRSVDPYGHPITIHRNSFRWVDRSLVDLDMLQTGHFYTTIEKAVRSVKERVDLEPHRPVLIGESHYEDDGGGGGPDVQRLLFWASIMSGSCGHTYGNGAIWLFLTETERFDAIVGHSDKTWYEAMRSPSTKQLGISKAFLERYPWWEFKPRQEPDWDESERVSPLAAGIPGRVWMAYLCPDTFEKSLWGLEGKSIAIEPDTRYRALLFNPRTGNETDLGSVEPDEGGMWAVPPKRTREDMVLVLERDGSA